MINKKKSFLLIILILLLSILTSIFVYSFLTKRNIEKLKSQTPHPVEEVSSFELAEGEPIILEGGKTFDLGGSVSEIGKDYIIIKIGKLEDDKFSEQEKKIIIDDHTEIVRLNLEEKERKNLEEAPREEVGLQEINIGDGVVIKCIEGSTTPNKECIALYIEVEPVLK